MNLIGEISNFLLKRSCGLVGLLGHKFRDELRRSRSIFVDGDGGVLCAFLQVAVGFQAFDLEGYFILLNLVLVGRPCSNKNCFESSVDRLA